MFPDFKINPFFKKLYSTFVHGHLAPLSFMSPVELTMYHTQTMFMYVDVGDIILAHTDCRRKYKPFPGLEMHMVA